MTGKRQANSNADPSPDQQVDKEQLELPPYSEVCSGTQAALLRDYTVGLSSSFVAHQMYVSVSSVSRLSLCYVGKEAEKVAENWL